MTENNDGDLLELASRLAKVPGQQFQITLVNGETLDLVRRADYEAAVKRAEIAEARLKRTKADLRQCTSELLNEASENVTLRHRVAKLEARQTTKRQPRVIYWERYHGDRRPATAGAWVWDDGSADSYKIVLTAPAWLNMPDYFFLRGADRSDIDSFLRNGPFYAVRYYTTR